MPNATQGESGNGSGGASSGEGRLVDAPGTILSQAAGTNQGSGSGSGGTGNGQQDVIEAPKIDELSFGRMWDYFVRQVTEWGNGFIEIVPELILASIALLLFVVISHLVAAAFRRCWAPRAKSKVTSSMVGRLMQVSTILVGIFVAIGILGFDGALVSLLTGVGLFAIVLGFALRDIFENLIIGILMAARKPFDVGDVVKTNGYFGYVRDINLRNTLVETFLGQMVILPNKDVYMNAIENYSTTGYRKLEFEAPVSFRADLDEWKNAVHDELTALDWVAHDEDVEVYGMSIEEWAYTFIVRIRIAYPETDYFSSKDDCLRALHRAYAKSGAPIPWPIRSLDFDPQGGTGPGDLWRSGDDDTSRDQSTAAGSSPRPRQHGDSPEEEGEGGDE